MKKRVVTVGQSAAELTGSTHVVVQAAIDYLFGLGGGTVKIGEGVYDIGSSVHLRTGVHLEGTPGKTVFRKCAEAVSPLAADADMHERQFTAVHPERFRPGDSVTIRSDDIQAGFFVTVATVVAEEGNVRHLDRQIEKTALLSENGYVSTNFPVISGYRCSDLSLKHIVVEGNKEHNSFVEGCRNGGIFLFEAQRVAIEACVVRNYNGDGISYQCCEDIEVRNCDCIGNGGKGIHPGSGTKRTVIAGCNAADNGLDGIFICWRVQHSLVEHCTSTGNGWSGLSIGHKDTHNVIRNNRFSDNRYYGVFFRNEPDPMGANYNVVEHNVIEDNGSDEMGYVGIRIRGYTREVDIRNNRISFRKAPLNRTIGVCIEEHARDIRLQHNDFDGCAAHTHSSWILD